MAEALTREPFALEPDVLRAAAGDRQAFGRLIDATRTTVCSVALAVVRDVEASEDVAQDVYLQAWRGLPRLRSAASFLPWLRQLTRNRAHDALRSDRPWRRARLDEAMTETLVDPGGAPDTGVLAEAEQMAIRDALDELGAEAREILILFYREERSIRQVATLLDLSEAAVKKRLERARRAMRASLETGVAEALRRTKPGATFSVTVLAALPTLAPVAATATKGVLGTLGASKLLAVFGAALAGLALAIGGVLIGYRYMIQSAEDDRERRELKGLALFGSASLVAAALGATLTRGSGDPLVHWTVWQILIVALLAIQQWILLPRVIARRLAAEVARDPSAATRHAREHRRRQIWFAVGVLAGFAPLIASAIRSMTAAL